MKTLYSLALLLIAFQSVAVSASPDARVASTPPPAETPKVPQLNKIMWIWLENTAYSDMVLQKYIKNVWFNIGAGRFNNFKPVSAVTQANAMAMISGTDLQITDNELTRVFTPTIVDLLESKNIPWKVYAGDYPGSCYLSAGMGNYKRYRVPFLSLASVQSDRYLCAKVQGFQSLMDDLQFGATPQMSIVIPHIKDAGTAGGATGAYSADLALRKILEPLVNAPEEFARMTIIISTMNMVDPAKTGFAMIFGNKVNTNGTTSAVAINHYSILRTIEEGLRLGSLNQLDATAAPIIDIWKP